VTAAKVLTHQHLIYAKRTFTDFISENIFSPKFGKEKNGNYIDKGA
jgi:hypothetical protein